MPYEIPTAAQLIARYPVFTDVPEATIDVHISDAAASGVDTSWQEADYQPAIAALAAHNMALLNIGDHGQAATYLGAGVTEVRDGAFDVKFSEGAASRAHGGGFDATPYGRTYYTLLRRNRGGPRLVGGGLSDNGWGPTAQQNDGGVLPWVG